MPLATDVVDLVLFSVVMHLSEGPTSPFFIYFVFATVCGALRWHGRGALLTGIALAAYGVVMMAGSALLMEDDSFDQTRFIPTWQEDEEPSLRVAVLDRQHVSVSHESPDAFETLVAPPLERSSFFCTNAPADAAFVVHPVPGGFASWRGRPLGTAFSDRYAVKSVLALRLATDDIEGYLFALDRPTTCSRATSWAAFATFTGGTIWRRSTGGKWGRAL